ncbi:MAG: hypothetical protein E7420_05590 [Ruminococcaceae bacterium]|nr:hypothetical protein [Oscillospiraceae bacterium]
MGNRIKIWELSLLIALCVCLCQTAAEAESRQNISEKIIRFHVVAASDEEEDQDLKMRVKDAVAAKLEELLVAAESASEAERIIAENKGEIFSAAFSASEGERVELRFGTELFSYREGDGYALPPGEYKCLRLILGAGEGHNWWGVIFPQLSVEPSCTETALYYPDEELRIIYDEDGVELRFRFLEILEKAGKQLGILRETFPS